VVGSLGQSDPNGCRACVWVDVPGPTRSVARRISAEECGPHLSALARQAGLLRAPQVVILGDGATGIWKLAEEHIPGAVPIVDASHACEHVWDVARAACAAESNLLSLGKREELSAAMEKLPPLPAIREGDESFRTTMRGIADKGVPFDVRHMARGSRRWWD